MQRPAKRIQLNHTRSSLAPPFPVVLADRHPAAFCGGGYGDSKIGCGAAGLIPGPLRDHFVAKKPGIAALQPRALTAIFARCPREGTAHALCRHQRSCPALFRGDRKRDTDRLPARIRRRPHQLGAADALFRARPPLHRLFRPRLYALRCAAIAGTYSYRHFYTDALAVLDHLGIAKAHLVGLSMGSYSSLQIALNAPDRALSMTLAGVGSGSDLDNLDAFRRQCQATAEQFATIGSAEVAKVTREAPGRIPSWSRTHADMRISTARWRGTIPGALPTPCAAFRAAGPRSTR